MLALQYSTAWRIIKCFTNISLHLWALFAEVKKKLHYYCEDWANKHRDSHKSWPYDEILFCLHFSVPNTTRCHVLITSYSDSGRLCLHWLCYFPFLPCKFGRVFWQLDKVLSLELLLVGALGRGEHFAQPQHRRHRANEDQDQSLSGSRAIPR